MPNTSNLYLVLFHFSTFIYSLTFFTLIISGPLFAQSPVDTYGALRVKGNKIVDQKMNPVSLAGNSFFWSNTGWGGEKYYNEEVVLWLKEDWNATIIRAAMGVDEYGGYKMFPDENKQRVKRLVDAAIAHGLYIIIDWHSHHAEDSPDLAAEFFSEMAKLYGEYENVIYEIYNEPLQVDWNNVIKPYAQQVIKAIRDVDPDNLIIVGTPTWSQDVDIASQSPITGYENIAYTLHFYAATHKESLIQKAQTALNNNIALMVTEWGTVSASGDGAVDEASTNTWMKFIKDNHLSHLNWSVNDKVEGASILKPGSSTSGGWQESDLTSSGIFVKNIVKNWGPSVPEEPEPPVPPEGGVRLKVRSLLEGYMDKDGKKMKLDLNQKGLIPNAQPFNEPPYEYAGQEVIDQLPASMVDWILLELRDANKVETVVSRRAAWVDENGNLHDMDGSEGIQFEELDQEEYVVALIPRGHLAIMSREPIKMGTDEEVLDFTISENKAYGQGQLKSVGNVFVQYAGDFDSNGIINNLDFNLWKVVSAGLNLYIPIDVDGNGIINNLDYNLWTLNRSKIGILSF